MEDIERKLFVQPEEKFKESDYSNSDVSALYYNLNPTEGPFIIIPSIEGDNKEPISVGYKLTIFSNNPVQLRQLNEDYNAVVIGKWEKDLSAGGCHLSEREKEASHVNHHLLREPGRRTPSINSYSRVPSTRGQKRMSYGLKPS